MNRAVEESVDSVPPQRAGHPPKTSPHKFRENWLLIAVRLVTFTAKTTIPPGKAPFLRKVRLEGDFGIDSARFTNFQTQQTVDKLSESARGEKQGEAKEDPERVLSDLKGHIVINNGRATFTNLSFGVPGALAHMHGTLT